jgi:hypothetical protein
MTASARKIKIEWPFRISDAGQAMTFAAAMIAPWRYRAKAVAQTLSRRKPV